MSKPFKSYEEQLNILKSRGLIIKNEENVLKALMRENYYNIINGYKDIFIDKLLSTNNIEKFKPNTTFEQIFELYNFDSEIRTLFLHNILKMENILKTKISYFFSQKYNQDFNFLNINNFDNNKKDKTAELIAQLSGVIRNCVSKSHSGEKQIKHYINTHKNLPLWVLSKQITFGNMSYLYSSLETTLQQEICDELSEEFKKEYGKNITIDTNNLESIIRFINNVRNICAHNDRLYNLIVKIPKKNTIPTINYTHINYQFNSKLFDILIILKLFITRQEFEKLVDELANKLKSLEFQTTKSIYGEILNGAGIPKIWKQIMCDALFWEETFKTEITINDEKIRKYFIFIETGSDIFTQITQEEILEHYKNIDNSFILHIYRFSNNFSLEVKIINVPQDNSKNHMIFIPFGHRDKFNLPGDYEILNIEESKSTQLADLVEKINTDFSLNLNINHIQKWLVYSSDRSGSL